MNAISGRISRDEASTFAGKVILVGAGPGAVDLLTQRAVRALESADIVFADGLVNDDLKAHVKPGATWVDAAKRVGGKTKSQQDTIDEMIVAARAGKTVIRLKGGDIGLFARGGEEIAGLERAGLTVELVPGVTAASAAAASAAFSLTHRDIASAVTFVTGHNVKEELPDLSLVEGGAQTVVVYMGIGTAADLVSTLTEKGYKPSTPVAVVEKASLPQERVLFGTLRTLTQILAGQSVESPALIVIGDVVSTSRGWWRADVSPSAGRVPSEVHFAHG
jgi:uroporphyrin-III C-methyltransferase